MAFLVVSAPLRRSPSWPDRRRRVLPHICAPTRGSPIVERRTRSLETVTPGRSRPSRSRSPSAFSALHRICCSRRRSSDWTSAATATGLARSVRTISITPREGWRHRHFEFCAPPWVEAPAGSARPSVPGIGRASEGQIPRKKRTLRSAPNATPIEVRTSMLGWTWFASIRPRCDRWTPTTDASVGE